MRVEAHYVIRPNTQLLQKSAEWSQESGELLRRPVVWTKEEGGRTAWTPQEWTAQVKLLFLLWLKHNFADNGTTPVSETVHSLLGEPPFNLATFDKWWTVERFTGLESFEGIQDSLSEQDFAAIGEINVSRVDHWIANLNRRVTSSRSNH